MQVSIYIDISETATTAATDVADIVAAAEKCRKPVIRVTRHAVRTVAR